MTETVLVTGGTGYVAGWCVAELLKRGYDVRTTLRDASRGAAVTRAVATEADPAGRLSFAVADLTADEGWKEAMRGVTYVLHVASPLGAGSDPNADLVTPARDGTLRILRAATEAGVRRVVMTSAANAASCVRSRRRWAGATGTASRRRSGCWAGSRGRRAKPSWTARAASSRTTPSDLICQATESRIALRERPKQKAAISVAPLT